MKKYFLLVLFVCMVMFVGCSDKDDDKDKISDYSSLPITGKWEGILQNHNGVNGYNHYIITEFKANGTGIEEQYGMYLGMKIDVEGSPMSFKWTGDKNTYTITNGQSFFSGSKNVPYSVEQSDGTTQLKVLGYTFTKK